MKEFREFMAQFFYYLDLIEIFTSGTRRVGNSVISICDDVQETKRALEDRNNRNRERR